MTETREAVAPGRELWIPEPATIVNTRQLTQREKVFTLQLPGGRDLCHQPGQFVQVSLFGFEEAPLSVCSGPERRGSFELCVRDMGGLTHALHQLGPGDRVGIRGAFGAGFPLEEMEGKDCLIIAGGIGLAPLRSLIQAIVANRDRYRRLVILYGARTPEELLFREDLDAWGADERNELLVTVDYGSEGWEGNVGVVTTLLPKVDLKPTKGFVVALVGPPVMYRFVLADLRALGMADEQVYVSLERRMRCGVGKCGHCQVSHRRVCVDGPVFPANELWQMPESI